jgi:hypothetical protein
VRDSHEVMTALIVTLPSKCGCRDFSAIHSAAASSTFLTEVSKWLSSFFKAMFPAVNDLWVSKLKKADIPCISSSILNDSIGVVEVINKLTLQDQKLIKLSQSCCSLLISQLYTLKLT